MVCLNSFLFFYDFIFKCIFFYHLYISCEFASNFHPPSPNFLNENVFNIQLIKYDIWKNHVTNMKESIDWFIVNDVLPPTGKVIRKEREEECIFAFF